MPVGNNQNPGLQPNIQPVQPIIPQQPVYPEVTQPPSTQNPIFSQNPFLPNANQNPTPVPKPINCNAYPPHPLCGETIILDSTTSEAPGMKQNYYNYYIIKLHATKILTIFTTPTLQKPNY